QTKGWSPERRAQQAARARALKPWLHTTGPKTDAGKARSSQNALKHGQRTAARIAELRKIRYALRVAAANFAAVNTLIAFAKAKRKLVPPQLKNAMAPSIARSKLPPRESEGAHNAAGSERRRSRERRRRRPALAQRAGRRASALLGQAHDRLLPQRLLRHEPARCPQPPPVRGDDRRRPRPLQVEGQPPLHAPAGLRLPRPETRRPLVPVRAALAGGVRGRCCAARGPARDRGLRPRLLLARGAQAPRNRFDVRSTYDERVRF